MKILLLGEYSNFHNSLKTGLIKLGHHVVLAGRKDGFKSYPLDISFDPKLTITFPMRYLRGAIYRLTKFDISSLEIAYLFFQNKKQLKAYDFVQLINEYPIKASPYFDTFLLKYIFKYNNNVYVSACGEDFTYLNFIIKSSLDYHILTPYLKNPSLKKYFKYTLNYLENSHKKLSQFVKQNAKAYIPADIDYYLAYQDYHKSRPLIPFPVNINILKYLPPDINNKIHIFHGINKINFFKKGNDYFCKALEIIEKKYGNRIVITQVESIPYKDYILLYDNCHILLDQVYSYDQGYNALEAMAKGKVVFTGAEEEWLTLYNLKEDTIAINALPDSKKIAAKLEWLILNPEKIIEISKNAREFVVKYHNYEKVAQQYIDCWQS